MANQTYSKIKIEDAEEICKRIVDDAASQARDILANSQKERSRIIEGANVEAENRVQEIRKKSETEIEKLKQKIFSTLNLEKKKLFLEEKNSFIEAIFENVKALAQEFRKGNGYREFLEKAILEGARIIGQDEVEVLYSSLDEKIIKEDLVKNRYGVKFEFKKSDFKDIGVIVQSKDSRLLYDNRFLARFKRAYDETYMRLLRESM